MSAILTSCVDTEMKVEVSYYEVYMDRCYDLLEPKAKEIMALDDKDGRVQLKGLSWVEVHSMDEFHEIFSTGVQRRKVAHTGLNDVSSRSHGVLTVSVKNGNSKGKLNLIDLAGNEDNRRSGNDGIRLQESAKINQSLFALSNVIYALNNNESRIPYRESKLTRILQDSLGGTSQALMVACLNPISYQEAVHTVSLAARSRHIVNHMGSASKKETPREKVDMEAKLRAWLESKEKKKKSVQRIGAFSPSFGRTPSSLSYSKNSESVRPSIKAKNKTTNARKLFDSAIQSAAEMEETNSCEVEESEHERILHEHPITSNNNNNSANQNDPEALHDKDQLQKAPLETGRDRDQDDAQLNNCSFVARDFFEGTSFTEDVNISKQPDLPGSLYNKENLQSPMNITESPSMNEKIKELRQSIRKVLSPVTSNVAANNHQPASDDRICIVLLEPKTPKTPSILTCDQNEVQTADTPFDKFDALSSNLKEGLVEKYLAFLNVASKDELLQLKGIGQKRAEYILELREETPRPLKSLSDLEKIGLSSKQVQDMFKRAARGIFA
ncbi:kinesin-like protein KIN-10C isoform X2 [Asparagus officinalis]|nr:kinesin-like protein KIN-10C isoform X2 [Asparagus officinalis]